MTPLLHSTWSALAGLSMLLPPPIGAYPLHRQEPVAVADAETSPEPADEATPAETTPSETLGSSAEPAAPRDTVELRDGGRIAGAILEVIPGDSLTIRSAATEAVKTIPWATIARYTDDGAWVTAAAPPPSREAPTSSGPRIHIDSPRAVGLYEITSEVLANGGNVVVHAMTYEATCNAPCDRPVDVRRGNKFFVGGRGLTASRRLDLRDRGSDLTLTVRPGYRAVWIGGIAALAGGSALTVLGALGSLDEEGNRSINVGMLAGGAAVVALGVALIILGKTRVRIKPRGVGLVRPLRF